MSFWTEETEAELRRLWAEGMSAGKIALAMGGASRNSIIGKAHRLGLETRPSPIRPSIPGSGRTRDREGRAKRKEAERILSAPVIAFDTPVYEVVTDGLAPEPAADSYGKAGCQWPLWADKVDHRYCGAKRLPGRPYCDAHWERSIIRRKPKDQAA